MDNIREKKLLEDLLENGTAPWKKWEREVPIDKLNKKILYGNITGRTAGGIMCWLFRLLVGQCYDCKFLNRAQ